MLSILAGSVYAQNVTQNELDILTGGKWVGESTYLDYDGNETETLRVELIVTKLKAGVYKFSYLFPDKPKANSTTKIKINSDGTKIAGKRILKVEKKPDGTLFIQADGKGADNREAAWFFFHYYLGSNKFSTKKEVQFKGDDKKFVRNEYRFTR